MRLVHVQTGYKSREESIVVDSRRLPGMSILIRILESNVGLGGRNDWMIVVATAQPEAIFNQPRLRLLRFNPRNDIVRPSGL
jgi:hypothetical protein